MSSNILSSSMLGYQYVDKVDIEIHEIFILNYSIIKRWTETGFKW